MMGQKNAEVSADVVGENPLCPMKARCVFQGSNISTGDGRPAHEIFQEVGLHQATCATLAPQMLLLP